MIFPRMETEADITAAPCVSGCGQVCTWGNWGSVECGFFTRVVSCKCEACCGYGSTLGYLTARGLESFTHTTSADDTPAKALLGFVAQGVVGS